MIVHIHTKSGSDEIKRFILVFIPLQLTMGRIVEYSQDHIRLLDDLPNNMTLAQKIVMSSVLPITKIIVIEDHKFGIIFLYVVFGSQSLLKPTSD
jgi:L-rhamnose isomerase